MDTNTPTWFGHSGNESARNKNVVILIRTPILT